jgi:hypothetical protein
MAATTLGATAAGPITAVPAAAGPVYAEVGRRGLMIPLDAFRARVGGEASLKKILGALSITEKVHPGRPRGMARAVHHAYSVERGALAPGALLIPRIKGLPFLRARTQAGLPLLDGVRAAPDTIGADGQPNPNAPLPPPRRIAASRLAAEEPLYEYQEAAIEYLCGPAGPFGDSAGPCGGVAYLQMDTGLGKTRVGCGVIARRGEAALVVVPTDAIANQWVDEFAEIYPGMKVEVYHNPPAKRAGLRGKAPPGPQTHDVVLVIINTFRDKTPDFMEGFGTVILDEAHEYHSAHNRRALWLSQTRAVLGLSATPEERPDGLDRYVLLHLGPIILPKTVPGFDVCAVSFRGEVRALEYAGHPDHCETATTPSGTMSAILTIGNVIRDQARLRLVAAEVERLYHLHETAAPDELCRLGLGPRPEAAATPAHPTGEVRRHGVFVFAEHREYLPALRAALLERLQPADILAPELGAAGRAATVDADKVSILRGGVAKTAVGVARRAGAHIVLTTYGFSRRGISLPDMTCIVEATPRRNGLRQILGRILRRGSDESIVRQVVDIVDMRTGLRSQAADRRKIYLEKGYPISRAAASWEDYAAPGAEARAAEPAPLGACGDAAEPDPSEDALAALSMDELLAAALGNDDGPLGACLGAAPPAARGPLRPIVAIANIGGLLGDM